jgi:hypothetical protein
MILTNIFGMLESWIESASYENIVVALADYLGISLKVLV